MVGAPPQYGSLFAQELRTPIPVSAKRLQKVWESLIR